MKQSHFDTILPIKYALGSQEELSTGWSICSYGWVVLTDIWDVPLSRRMQLQTTSLGNFQILVNPTHYLTRWTIL